MIIKHFRVAAQEAGFTTGKHRGQDRYTVGNGNGEHFFVSSVVIEKANSFSELLIGREYVKVVQR